VVLVDDLPITPMLKIDKRALTERASNDQMHST
jgi:non-ribosomal peptide synthetase component E (peptide arylation enzyme)